MNAATCATTPRGRATRCSWTTTCTSTTSAPAWSPPASGGRPRPRRHGCENPGLALDLRRPSGAGMTQDRSTQAKAASAPLELAVVQRHGDRIDDLKRMDPAVLVVAKPKEHPGAVAALDQRGGGEPGLCVERPGRGHVPRARERLAEDIPGAEPAEPADLLRALPLRLAREDEQRLPLDDPDLGTSSSPNPAGVDSGGCSSQASMWALRACPSTPARSDAAPVHRAVMSMCQPSPPGSLDTNGSRHVALRAPSCASVRYHRRSGTTSDPAPTRRHRNRSSDSAIPIRWS